MSAAERIEAEKQSWLEANKRFIYAIQSSAQDKVVKIGWSEDVEKRRLSLLNCAAGWAKSPSHLHKPGELSVVFTIPVAYPQQHQLENEIHRLFWWCQHKIDGRFTEWFINPNYHEIKKIDRTKYIADWTEFDDFLESWVRPE